MPTESTFRKNFHDQFQGQLLIDGWLLYMIRESYTQKCHDNSGWWLLPKLGSMENCRKNSAPDFCVPSTSSRNKIWGWFLGMKWLPIPPNCGLTKIIDSLNGWTQIIWLTTVEQCLRAEPGYRFCFGAKIESKLGTLYLIADKSSPLL